MDVLRPVVNFTRSFFERRYQKCKKDCDCLTVFFALLGSVRLKAVREMLVKSTPVTDLIKLFFISNEEFFFVFCCYVRSFYYHWTFYIFNKHISLTEKIRKRRKKFYRIDTWSMSLGTMTVNPRSMSAMASDAMKWWLGRRRWAWSRTQSMIIWRQFHRSHLYRLFQKS